jgi:DivIVA domain-containing protein
MAIDVSPNFTMALRGYDKDQVDQYLDSLSERTSDADEQLYELQEQSSYLESEHERLLARVEELESAIRTETPHTVAALGQRITLILSEAEEGASDTITQAEARAQYLVSEAERLAETTRRQAEMFSSQANETLAGAQRQAEALAERLEAEARGRAASIVGDAQMRAQRRHDQIESWAQEVIVRTQADQARLTEEFVKVRRQHDADLQALLGQRDDAVTALRTLQGALIRAIERVLPDAESGSHDGQLPGDQAEDNGQPAGRHAIAMPAVVDATTSETEDQLAS